MTHRISIPRQLVPLALFTVVCLAVFYSLYRGGGGTTPFDEAYEVQVVVPDAVTLVDQSSARMSGVEVGSVTGIANRAGNAILDVRIEEESVTPIYENASAQVRTKSLLGESYLEIEPGTPDAEPIPEGGVLPIENTDLTTELDEIISVLDNRGRTNLRRMIKSIGAGVRGRDEQLNAFIGSAAGSAVRGRTVADVLGEKRRELARLIVDLGTVMTAIGDRGDALRVFARRGRVVAEAVADRDEALARTLEELPSTLDQIGDTTSDIGLFSERSTDVVGDLATAVDRLGPAITKLYPTVSRTRQTVRALGRFAEEGSPLLRELGAFSKGLRPATGPLDGTLSEGLPLIRYLSLYNREFGALLANSGDAANTRDATGNLMRIYGIYDDSSLPFTNAFSKQVLDALFDLDVLHPLRTRGHNGYPKPGEIGEAKPFEGKFPRVNALGRLLG